MNRTIRFRAWVNKGIQPFMVNVTDLDLEGGEVYVEGSMAFKLGEEADLMQFTGLYDKNNVPIYEGDIVRNEHDQTPNHKVVEDRGMFCIDDYEMPLWKGNPKDFWEVIGNIYESPELLNS